MNNKEIIKKLKNIKLLVMDVDGTLTDGSMYYSKSGEELKRFFVKDGMGIVLLQKAGIKTVFLTSENSAIAKKRGEKLNIDKVILGSNNKSKELEDLTKEFKLEYESIAYIGDDVNDLHAITLVGFSACPNDSVNLIKESVDYVCKNDGGRGAVRELAEMILNANNKSIIVFENW